MPVQPRPVMERLMEKVIVDQNGCWIFTGSKKSGGYGGILHDGKVDYSHRVVYRHAIGDIPQGMLVDHRCSVRACCNPEHLRLVTGKQNAEHLTGASKNSKAGVRGVHRISRSKKNPWLAQVGHQGRNIYIGLFPTLEEAEAAVRAKRAELFTHDDHEQWTSAMKETGK